MLLINTNETSANLETNFYFYKRKGGGGESNQGFSKNTNKNTICQEAG